MSTFNLNPPIKEPVITNGVMSQAWVNFFLQMARYLKANEIGSGGGGHCVPDKIAKAQRIGCP